MRLWAHFSTYFEVKGLAKFKSLSNKTDADLISKMISLWERLHGPQTKESIPDYSPKDLAA